MTQQKITEKVLKQLIPLITAPQRKGNSNELFTKKVSEPAVSSCLPHTAHLLKICTWHKKREKNPGAVSRRAVDCLL